jgi:hypothetical protein
MLLFKRECKNVKDFQLEYMQYSHKDIWGQFLCILQDNHSTWQNMKTASPNQIVQAGAETEALVRIARSFIDSCKLASKF